MSSTDKNSQIKFLKLDFLIFLFDFYLFLPQFWIYLNAAKLQIKSLLTQNKTTYQILKYKTVFLKGRSMLSKQRFQPQFHWYLVDRTKSKKLKREIILPDGVLVLMLRFH